MIPGHGDGAGGNGCTRRQLLKGMGGASLLAFGGSWQSSPAMESAPEDAGGAVPLRMLGRTGVRVSALAFGGAHWAYNAGPKPAAIRLLHEALEAGITFMDTAWEYADGRSETMMGEALQGRRAQVFLMTKVCTHGRGKEVAMRQLEESLRRLKTDYLDLWQIHEVSYEGEAARHTAPGGTVEALLEATRQGKVRFIGFTGHKDPARHLDMLAQEIPFDTCQLPLNVFDATYRSFEREVLPVLVKRGIAPLAMKSFCGNAEPIVQGIVTPDEALRYVLSLPVASVVSGIDSRDVLRQNLDIVRRFTPMSEAEMQALRARVAPQAADGRYEIFKTTRDYDSSIGQSLHIR
jgi:uncharacterized protein